MDLSPEEMYYATRKYTTEKILVSQMKWALGNQCVTRQNLFFRATNQRCHNEL